MNDIIAALNAHQSFLIAAHVGPDGDAIGSGLALRFALEGMGKKAWLVSTDGVPLSCRYLPHSDSVLTSPPTQPECAVIIDCDGKPDRVAAPFRFVENARTRVLIDHHRTALPIFEANWIDPSQPAVALMIFQLLREMNVALTPDMATCLLCGLSTDTGHFRFSNTTPQALRAGADLVEAGGNLAQTAFKLFDERSLAATKLLGVAVAKAQAECEGQLMWVGLSEADFASVNAADESSESVVNVLRNVRGARMAIVLRERGDEIGPTARVSVRSDPALRADLFCAEFGGGGHAAAAGCRLRRPFEEAVEVVTRAAREWLGREHPALVD